MSGSSPPRPGAVAQLALAAVALQFLVLGVLHPLVRPHAYSDFATFHAAARCFAEGRDPYDAAVLRQVGEREWSGWIGRYFYPPAFAGGLLRPLAHVPFATARRVWILLEATAYLAAVALLAGVVLGHAAPGRRMAAALALSFAPMAFDLRLGSVSGLLLLLTSAALAARARGRDGRAAGFLAGAILLKVVPAIVLLPWTVRGEFRLVLRTAAAALLAIVVLLPWTGVQAYERWLHTVVPALARDGFTWFTNQSLDAALGRLLIPNTDTTPWVAAPGLHRVLAFALVATTLAVVVAIARATRHDARGSSREWLATASALAAGPLVARVAWEYLAVLALPLFFAWAGRVAWARARATEVVLLGCAWACCAWPFPYADAPIRSGPGLLLAAPRTLGLVLVVAVTFAHVRRINAAPRSGDSERGTPE